MKQVASLFQRLAAKDLAWRKSFEVELTSPERRRRARFFLTWIDHGILRSFWTNQHEIAPGVFRSNHPTEKRFRALKERGVTTILNLRGASLTPPYLLEREICDALGLTLVDLRMTAYSAPTRKQLIDLAETLQNLPKPFLVHCKSGADRSGLAAAIYLLLEGKTSVAQAKKMLSLRYAHNRWSKTGVLDCLLDSYGEAARDRGTDLMRWIRDDYDAQEIQSQFDAQRRK